MSKINKTDKQWQEELDALTYHVTREKGTERPFTGKYDQHFEEGIYHCTCCGAELFKSESKFDAGCGWPSFDNPAEGAPVAEHVDTSHGMVRTEVVCDECGAHLGHVFPDGPTESGLRYCINSVSIEFKNK